MTEPNSLTTWHGDTFPADCCDNCRGRRREAVALAARANLLRQAIHDREPFGVIVHHAVELVEMMQARGLC